SFAIGGSANASGANATALTLGQASGDGATALYGGVASGEISLAWAGSATGGGAISLGGADAGGENSVAIQGGNVTADRGFAYGASSIASAVGAVAIGGGSTASGNGSFAIGGSANASGANATALTLGQASGDGATALYGGVANGEISLAWAGTASGDGSISLGGSDASGENAVVIGNGTVASGNESVAIGTNVTAYSFAETVIGYESNAYTPVSTTTFNAADRLFVVANNSVNNAMTLLKNGRLGLSRIPTTNILEVNGTASKTVAGDWLANSDRRLKKNIKTFNAQDALNKLLRMRGVTYEWNDQETGNNRPEGQQYGFIAQELQQVFPENVSLDNQGYYQTAYGTYDALYVQSIKALNTKVEILEKENQELKTKLDELYEMVKSLSEQ
ncbi:tail fiber domain-containing protein, partial [Winogradskyella sp.]|uniref:tail fiber domain-containing protein n=1 Tax=Winogradskyella sp. TaxID=1883156 RepID=UPI002610AB3D